MRKAKVVIKVIDTEFEMADVAEQADLFISDEVSETVVIEVNEDKRKLVVQATFNEDLSFEMMRGIIEETPCYIRMDNADPDVDGTRDLAIEVCGFEPTK